MPARLRRLQARSTGLLAAVILVVTAAAAAAAAVEKPLVEGNPDSSVRIIVYEDLQCSDCAVFRAMLDAKILPKFGSKIAIEHRDFPLTRHKWARRASVASRYFATIQPGLAIEWRRYAMANQSDFTPENFESKLATWALKHGADPSKVASALNDTSFAGPVEADYQEGIARGIARTPTVLVDGEPFIEAFTFEEIAQAIEKAIRGK